MSVSAGVGSRCAPIFAFLLLVLATGGCAESTSPSGRAFDQAVYVWQRVWTPQVREAVAKETDVPLEYFVQSGEIDLCGDALCLHEFKVDYDLLARQERAVTLVFRVRASVAGEIRANEGRSFAEWSAPRLEAIIKSAAEQGLAVDGVQLDYDCAESKIGEYAEAVRDLRRLMREETFSVTALPSWLSSRGFKDLARSVDYYVLQVHSLHLPKRLADEPKLFDVREALAAARKASRIGVPYYVALPTYGYELSFDSSGAFIGIRAEQAGEVSREATVRELYTSPRENLDAVRRLEEEVYRHMLGIAWFRLPVEGDRYNWTWHTFSAVIAGELPANPYHAEAVATDEVIEIVISAESAIHYDGNIEIAMKLDGSLPPARDTLGGYTEFIESGNVVLRGPAPGPGERKIAAWYRSNGDSFKLRVTGVELLQ